LQVPSETSINIKNIYKHFKKNIPQQQKHNNNNKPKTIKDKQTTNKSKQGNQTKI